MMDIRLTDGALADLRTIEAQIGLQSHRQAAAMIERIYERFDGLASFPRLGPMVHERKDRKSVV